MRFLQVYTIQQSVKKNLCTRELNGGQFLNRALQKFMVSWGKTNPDRNNSDASRL